MRNSAASPGLLRRVVLALAAACAAPAAALAGPPYLSDDPEPTDTGRWEIYNFVIGAQDRSGLAGEAGLDLNYGAAKDTQLTAVLPLGYSDAGGFSAEGLRGGTGVIELAVKYKFLHADDAGWMPDVSVFPRVFIPTNRAFGDGHPSLFLPVWAEKDAGPWQVFGGGGFQINPGAGQRDFWQGGLALARSVTKSLQLGVEVYGQTRSGTAAPGYRTLNFGEVLKLSRHWSLLASAGPSWEARNALGDVFYVSLKADY